MSAPDPQESRRNRRFLLIFLGVFVATGIGTLIYGFEVVDRVKMQASRSDMALRLRAWSIMAVVDATGQFPVDEAGADAGLDRLTLDGRLAEGSGTIPSDFQLSGEALPSSREEAIGNFTVQGPPIDAEVVREIVAVSWDPEGQLPPVLSVSGRPSGLVEGGTTLELVNVWLRRAGDRLGR